MTTRQNNRMYHALSKIAGLLDWKNNRTFSIPASTTAGIDENISNAKVSVPRSVTKNEMASAKGYFNNADYSNDWDTAVNSQDHVNPILQKGQVTLKGKYSGSPYSIGLDTHGNPFFGDDRSIAFPASSLQFTGPSGRQHNWTITGEDGSPIVASRLFPGEVEQERQYLEDLKRYVDSRVSVPTKAPAIPSDESAIANAINGGALNSPESYLRLVGAINGLDRDTLLRLRDPSSDLSGIPEEARDEYRALLNSAAQKPYRDRGMTYNEAEYMLLGDEYKDKALTDLVTRDLGHAANTSRDDALMTYLSSIRTGRDNGFTGGSPEMSAARAVAQIRDAEVADLRKRVHDKYYGPDAVLRTGHLGGPTIEDMISEMGLDSSRIPMKNKPISGGRMRHNDTVRYETVRDDAAIRNMFKGWLDQQVYGSDAFQQSEIARNRLNELERAYAEQRELRDTNPKAGVPGVLGEQDDKVG